MESYRISQMTGGWFVGAFTPTALATGAAEVAVKSYDAGATEAEHFHKVSTEVTLVVEGRVMMCGREWGPGDIIVLTPGEATGFEAITRAVSVVVKVPGALNDKYLVE